ncbi:acyl carrier protein [Parahaliea sp. F7430]|uniref:Acyl carrier protein n=1 Tax=Sediminihaliea albiluteola TaxID=2758564 RepID=A0A7W2TVJ9_9GAMM|nr:acyl carrier protein [Sediminihaliea albiluteola]MBA6412691.1 acyl carrier protein [Sediminihaliea albiluteola]
MDALTLTRHILQTNLQLDAVSSFQRDTALLGAIPEFNSLTITSILASIEDETGCEIYDDEISGEIFESVGSLADFIEAKMS